MLLIYRIFFPVVFLFFLPGLLIKLIRRPGWKKTYWERFGVYSKERKAELKAWQGSIWVHAVSVGETNLALTLLKEWSSDCPDQRFILSTTTTTAQEIARKKAGDNVRVIFCPIDFHFIVRRVFRLLKPAGLVIMETELWPNMLALARKRHLPTVLINARISDKSFGGYYRFRMFFGRVLNNFSHICAQTETDSERLLKIAPDMGERVTVCGNIKFDQQPVAGNGFDYSSVFGPGKHVVFLGTSTHNPEEALIIENYKRLHAEIPDTRLCIVPRHAERGADIERQILDAGFTCLRRSNGNGTAQPDVLLADTTGELPNFIKSADIILMGKTMAGNDEGQNIIEPAVMGKPIICGPKLKNFRQALDVLVKGNAVCRMEHDSELYDCMKRYAADAEARFALGERAHKVMAENHGALRKCVVTLEEVFKG